MTPSRRIAIAGAVVAVIVLVALKLGPLRGGTEVAGPRTGAGGGTAQVRALVVGSERISDRVTAAGTIRADEEVQIRSEISGKVRAIKFREGSRVGRGDVLVEMDDDELRAQLARAEARFSIASDEAARQKQLFDQSVTSQREYDDAANNAAVASAEMDLIRAQLAKTTIRAPFDGVVGLRQISEGSYVTPATWITTLQDHTPAKIEFSVPERYAARIRAGDKVSFTVQGIQRTFEGSVYALDPGIDTVTRTLRVRATAPNDDGVLVPGSFASVDVAFADRETIMVPAHTVMPELKGHRVFVLASGKAQSRPVEIGTRTDTRVEVLQGLQPGDTLITSALLQLRPGTDVDAVVEPAP